MQETDADLLAAAAAGDADAYTQFFRRHVRPVTLYAVRRCAGPEEVADMVSETFLIGLEAAGRYQPMHDTALPWLFGIARRVLARQRRRWVAGHRLAAKAAGAAILTSPDESDAIVGAIDAARQGPRLEQALGALPPTELEVFLLVAYDGLTPSEAGVALDISANAARLRLSRAKRKLRIQLDQAPVSVGEARHAI